MRFNELPHPNDAMNKIKKSIASGRLPQALLLSGEEGSAHLQLAYAVAQYLQCSEPVDNEICKRCQACHLSKKMIHPDIHLFFPMGTTAKIKGKEMNRASFLSDWRKWFCSSTLTTLSQWSAHLGHEVKQLQIGRSQANEIHSILETAPSCGKSQVILIWLPELLHTSAANALLKIIEEPPVGSYFLLVSNDLQRVLPTIISRSWVLTSTPMIQKNKESPHHTQVVNWFRALYSQDHVSLVKQAQRFHEDKMMVQRAWVKEALTICRAVLWVAATDRPLTQATDATQQIAQKMGVLFDELDPLTGIITHLQYMDHALQQHAQGRLLFLSTSLRCAEKMQLTKKNRT